MTSRRLMACCVFGLTAVACSKPTPAPRPAVVATVGDQTVLASELREALERVRLETGGAGDPATFEELKSGVLDKLVEHRLLLAEARRTDIVVTDEDVEALVARRIASVASAPPGSTAPSPAEMKARLREQLLVDRLLVREVVGRTALGPEEAREWYDEHREELGTGERVRARQIVTRTKEEATAARREVLRGADFEKLARERSIAPDARAGGDLGWFARGQMPPVVEDTCFALRARQVSEVVQSPWGFHVFKLIDRDEGDAPSFAEARKSIELELRRQAVARAQTEYMARLRERVGITIDAAELARVGPSSAPEARP